MLYVAGPVGADSHDGGGHPERPARIDAALAGVADLDLGDELVMLDPFYPDRGSLALVHSVGYLAKLETISASGDRRLDPDTFVTADSWDTARRAAGAGLAAIDAVHRAGEGVAFVAARPPGHHATVTQGMGFCLLNNIAIGAASLSARGERVLIVDWDVHHGNGTQDIFFDDPSVLYVSTHQWPLYPGTGRPEEVGVGEGTGFTINLPLPAGATGDVVERMLRELAAPQIEAFAPTWVLVSAGFDAHRDDPLAGLALSSGDFARLARTAGHFAGSHPKVVLYLEGGYDLRALQWSVASSLGALLGDDEGVEAPTSGGAGSDEVATVGRLWRRAVDHQRAGGEIDRLR